MLFALAYYYLYKFKKKRVIEEITVWLIFSVFIALLPILFNFLAAYYFGKDSMMSGILSRGELLIVAVAIGAEATGKLISSDKPGQKIVRIIAGGGCVILIILSSTLFAITSNNQESILVVERVTNNSVILFFIMLITSGSCVLISELEVD